MHVSLIPHPSIPCALIDSFDVHLQVDAAKVRLRYAIAGDIDSILLPARSAPERRDRLWQHTCFELFVGALRAGQYFEFNFSPSTSWAAYAFDDYRAGMKDLAYPHAPHVHLASETGRLTLETEVELAFIGTGALEDARLGLAAVVEDRQLRKSYWALAHPVDKPDFHHPDAFTLAIAPGASR